MRKIFSIITFILLVFVTSTTFNVNEVFATNNTDIKQEVQNEIPEKLATNQVDDVLEKPIFQDEMQQPQENKLKNKISSIIIRIIGGVLLLLIATICLLFIVVANKQRQNELKRRQMSSNSNVINAVDNFARHRIRK